MKDHVWEVINNKLGEQETMIKYYQKQVEKLEAENDKLRKERELFTYSEMAKGEGIK